MLLAREGAPVLSNAKRILTHPSVSPSIHITFNPLTRQFPFQHLPISSKAPFCTSSKLNTPPESNGIFRIIEKVWGRAKMLAAAKDEGIAQHLRTPHPEHLAAYKEHCLPQSHVNTSNGGVGPSPPIAQPSAPAPAAPLHPSTAEVTPLQPISRRTTDASELPLDSIVKVFAVQTAPNHFLPWQMKEQKKVTGSGFIIDGRRILTNAHVIAYQTSVMVRRHGQANKYPATVLATGHECDMAMLTVEDDTFWENLPALEFGSIPELQDAVTVVGYPTGGDNISVTGGVVSRIELQQYAHGDAHLPAVQIDAAINPGNSGGPVLKDGKVVGIAFQHLVGAEAMGFIIPMPIISRFLEDIAKNGKYTGFGHLGAYCQPMEAHCLHRYFTPNDKVTGVLVNKVYPLSKAFNILKKDDIITAIDGIPLANDGTIVFRKKERIFFNYLLTNKFVGDSIRATVLRDNQLLELDVPISASRPLVPVHQFDRPPSYFVHAGLVFVPLIQPYLHEYGEEWYNNSPRKLCDKALYGIPTQEDEQVVVLSQVLMDKINYGYQNLANFQVVAFNGTKIKNLAQLVKLVEENDKPHLRFDLDEDMVVIIDGKEAAEANPRILSTHRIPSTKSADLQAILTTKTTTDVQNKSET